MTNELILLAIGVIVVLAVLQAKQKQKAAGATPPVSPPAPEPVPEPDIPTDEPTPPAQGGREPCTIMRNGEEVKGEMEMAHGLRVWDENGRLILNTEDRLVKVLGEIRIQAQWIHQGKYSGSVYDAKLEGGDFWYTFSRLTQVAAWWPAPNVRREGNRIYWEFPDQYHNPVLFNDIVVLYGIY